MLFIAQIVMRGLPEKKNKGLLMKMIPGFSFLLGLSLLLNGCGQEAGDISSIPKSSDIIIVEDRSWEAFSRLSYKEQLRQASALLIIRYDIDDQGTVTPIVTHRKSRLGSDSPPYQVGDVYLSESQKSLLEHLDGELRHLGDGAVVIFSDDPPRQRGNRIIRDGAVSGIGPIPVSTVLAAFDGEPVEVPTLEPNYSKGETGPIMVTVSDEEKDILVEILERRGLRYEVAPQPDSFVVGWIGMEEEIDRVLEEFDVACE